MADENIERTEKPHVTGWSGWIRFAGTLMTVSGVINIIYGLGGIFNQNWYVYTSTNAYLFSSSSWGWSMLISGALLILSASLLLAGNMIGRILGVLLAISNLLFNSAVIGASPVWSIIAIVVDILIIYAIIAHGSEMKR